MMRSTKIFFSMAFASIVLAWTTIAGAQQRAAAQHHEQYMVVQVGDDLSVIPKSQLTEEKKRVAQEYKEEMKTYEQAKKDAVKKKEKIDLAKPMKHIVKILKNGLKSEQEADDWKTKYLEDHKGGNAEPAKTNH